VCAASQSGRRRSLPLPVLNAFRCCPLVASLHIIHHPVSHPLRDESPTPSLLILLHITLWSSKCPALCFLARDEGRDGLFPDPSLQRTTCVIPTSPLRLTSCSMTPLGRFNVGNGIAIMESTPAKDGKKFIFFFLILVPCKRGFVAIHSYRSSQFQFRRQTTLLYLCHC
jgi:hypothetical protein